MLPRLLAALGLAVGLTVPAAADQKLKTQAAEALKKAEVKDGQVVETTHVVVGTSLPAAKARGLADHLEKVFSQAARILKLNDGETKGQFTVFAFTDLDNFKQFQRSVLKVRPDDDDTALSDVRRDDPYIAVSARRSEKRPDFESLAGTELCRALLAKKAGNARLTEWMKDGFAKAVEWRTSPAAASRERSAVARMAPRLRKGAKGECVVEKAWSGTGKEKDLVAASLMDYFTSGPGADKFGTLLSALIPTDAGASPSFQDALKGTAWMPEDLDRAWREWVSKGSPATTK